VPFAGSKDIQIIWLVCRGGRPPRLEVPSLSDRAWKLTEDCWAKEKTTRPVIEDVMKRMMIWETLQGSAPTQHRCVKDERVLSNGLCDNPLPIIAASKQPLHLSPSTMFDRLPLMAGKLSIVGVWLRPRSDICIPARRRNAHLDGRSM